MPYASSVVAFFTFPLPDFFIFALQTSLRLDPIRTFKYGHLHQNENHRVLRHRPLRFNRRDLNGRADARVGLKARVCVALSCVAAGPGCLSAKEDSLFSGFSNPNTRKCTLLPDLK